MSRLHLVQNELFKKTEGGYKLMDWLRAHFSMPAFLDGIYQPKKRSCKLRKAQKARKNFAMVCLAKSYEKDKMKPRLKRLRSFGLCLISLNLAAFRSL